MKQTACFANIRPVPFSPVGFVERVRGDHPIFTRDDVEEILNLQPKQAKAKPYQVKQVRAVIHRYRLAGDHDNDE